MGKTEILVVFGVCLLIGIGLYYVAPLIPFPLMSQGLTNMGKTGASLVQRIIPQVENLVTVVQTNWATFTAFTGVITTGLLFFFNNIYKKLKVNKEQEVTEAKATAMTSVQSLTVEKQDLEAQLDQANAKIDAFNADSNNINTLKAKVETQKNLIIQLQSQVSAQDRFIQKKYFPKPEEPKVA